MDPKQNIIYHITTKTAWAAALDEGEYRADSLSSQGFIHASTAQQYILTANRYYHGQHGLVVLVIDTHRLASELRYEDSHGIGELFPHIYGPLNLDAVVRVDELEPGEDGEFK